jgi:hypothetical protein
MVKVFDRDNKYKTILVILLLMFFLIVSVSVIASNIDFTEKTEGIVATVLNEGDLVISYNDGNLVNVSDNDVHKYSISITNNSPKKLYYSILIEDCNIDILDVVIKDKDGNIVNEVKNIKEKILNLYSISGNQTVRYTIEVKNTKRFGVYGKLRVINESLTTEVFADLILLNNKINVPKTRLGSEVALEEEGLIESYDNDGKTYYFRGKTENNYFKLNNMMFRIVRINGDSTVRVVLDSSLTDKMAYNTNQLADGEQVNSLTLLANASVHTALNNWFNNNLKQYSTYLAKGSYCSDNTFDLVNNNISYSNSYERIFNDEAPDLFCSGVINKSYVGLLSVDEVVLAGASGNIPNTSYYLYNKNIEGNYITSNSYSINSQNGVTMINVMSNGALGDGILINDLSNIRPVINIGTNAKIKGKGTIDNPYIIVS